MGCHALLQGILPTQGSNPRLMTPALAGGFFTMSAIWEATLNIVYFGQKRSADKGRGGPMQGRRTRRWVGAALPRRLVCSLHAGLVLPGQREGRSRPGISACKGTEVPITSE